MDIEIRRAGPADAAALALVGQATILETYAEVLTLEDMLAHTRQEHGLERYAGWLADPAYRIWLAERADTKNVVGYVVLCPPDLETPTEADDLEIKRLYVLATLKGEGLGTKLMDMALAAARAAGARRALLCVYCENRAANAFYARLGFTQVGEQKFQVGDKIYDDLVLALAL